MRKDFPHLTNDEHEELLEVLYNLLCGIPLGHLTNEEVQLLRKAYGDWKQALGY